MRLSHTITACKVEDMTSEITYEEVMKREAEKHNELARLMRAKYGDNAVEALVGALTSVTTSKQLDALIASLTPAPQIHLPRL